MTTPIRWISVDDTSTDIQYSVDSWFPDIGSLDVIGNNGPPFLSTSHGTDSSARSASLTFTFSGSGLRVMGTYTGTQNSSTLYWTCFVDGVSLGKTAPNGDFDQNHRMFCQVNPMTDGPHTVTVNATVGENQTFWLDKIQYLPSASVSLENKTIQLDYTDPAIFYGSGWSSYQTQTNGSQVGCNFYGVSLSWYATETSGNSATGTWTVDDNSPNTFTVVGRGTNSTPVENEKFFETPKYSMGSHRLIVTYDGDNSSGSTPLNLAYLVVQNGTLPSSTTALPSPSSHAANTTSSTSSTHIGAIVGGAVGGVACLLIVFLVFFYRHRREKDRTWAAVDSSVIHTAHQSFHEGVIAGSLSCQTQRKSSVLLSPGPNMPQLDSSPTGYSLPVGVTPGPQNGQLMGNISPFTTVPRESFHQEEHLPRKLGNQAAEGLTPDGGVQPVQLVSQALLDAPPAYS